MLNSTARHRQNSKGPHLMKILETKAFAMPKLDLTDPNPEAARHLSPATKLARPL